MYPIKVAACYHLMLDMIYPVPQNVGQINIVCPQEISSSSYGKRSSVRSSSDGPPHCPVSHAVAELLCWDVGIFP